MREFQGVFKIEFYVLATSFFSQSQAVWMMNSRSSCCGAHGVSIEVHPDPDKALSDGDQSLNFPEFKALMEGLSRVRV